MMHPTLVTPTMYWTCVRHSLDKWSGMAYDDKKKPAACYTLSVKVAAGFLTDHDIIELRQELHRMISNLTVPKVITDEPIKP